MRMLQLLELMNLCLKTTQLWFLASTEVSTKQIQIPRIQAAKISLIQLGSEIQPFEFWKSLKSGLFDGQISNGPLFLQCITLGYHIEVLPTSELHPGSSSSHPRRVGKILINICLSQKYRTKQFECLLLRFCLYLSSILRFLR